MKDARMLLMVLAIVAFTTGQADETEKERAAKQAELDTACEEARQAKLIPLRAQFVEECVAKEQRPDRESCERFYADYGNKTGNRAALFYDLTECLKAFEYRQSYRRSGN